MEFFAPPGYQPEYHPEIPYLRPIFGGLREGTSIYIHGVVPEDVSSFDVNLRCEDNDSGNIALHINPRFEGWDKVVFNSFEEGSWRSEDQVWSMPFSKGESFELVIRTTSEGYQITVNGNDFHTFEHRIPVEFVHALQIKGDVTIKTINIIGGGVLGADMKGRYPDGMEEVLSGRYPGHGMSEGFPQLGLLGMGAEPIFNPTIPFTTMIPGGLSPKKSIIIRGAVPLEADRIKFNFVVSSTEDIAFHINPRIRDNVLVRNSKIDGNWGHEEREVPFNPFMESQYFEMSIRCGREKFKVFVDGEHLFDYSYRLHSLSEIDRLDINGTVQITYIHL